MILFVLEGYWRSLAQTARHTGGGATSWPPCRTLLTRTRRGPLGPIRSMPRRTRGCWKRLSNPVWMTLPLEIRCFPAGLFASAWCHYGPGVLAGRYPRALSQGGPATRSPDWNSWNATFLAFEDRIWTKPPKTLQPLWWQRSPVGGNDIAGQGQHGKGEQDVPQEERGFGGIWQLFKKQLV